MANPTVEDDFLTLTVFNTMDQVNKSNEVDPSQSFNSISVTSDSHDTVNFKDSISFGSDDNETPSSIMGSTNGKGLVHEEQVGMTSAHSNLKRNLIEAYDVDETSSESATKLCNKTNEGPKATGMFSLILNSRQLFQHFLVDGYSMISILPALDRHYNACSSCNKKVDSAQSFNSISVANDSQDTVNFKGILHEEEVGESSGHLDLKRKLIEVYDVHGSPSEYANKH